MKGIILGVDLKDYKSLLKESDLIFVDDEFYNLEKIDQRWNCKEGDPDNVNCYFVKSKINGELMNFERNEISKANISIFDSNRWFNDNIKIRLGSISQEDVRNMKFKSVIEWDIPTEKVDTLTDFDLLNLEFEGEVIEKEIYNYENPPTLVKYFKLV